MSRQLTEDALSRRAFWRSPAVRLAVGSLPVLLAGCAPRTVSEQGTKIHTLYNQFMITAAFVFVIVAGLILWSVFRYRRRSDDLPPQFHGNSKLEATWTVIPVLIVIFLFVLTYRTQRAVMKKPANPAVTITVTGFQWNWRFAYEGGGPTIVGVPGHEPVMELPLGQPVLFKVTGADVIHSFYVINFMYKIDAVPGRTNFETAVPDRLGTFEGKCAEYCGVEHSNMNFQVKVVPPDEYQRWLRSAPGAGT